MLSTLPPSLSVVSVKPYGPRDDEREGLADEGGGASHPQTQTQTHTQGEGAPAAAPPPTPTANAVAVKVPVPTPVPPPPPPLLERFPPAPPRYHWTGEIDSDAPAGQRLVEPADGPRPPLAATPLPPAVPATATPAPATATPAPPVVTPPPVVATPTPATATPPVPLAYVGEPAVSPEWLQQREAALVLLRTDYETQRARAQADPGDPGWITVESPNHDGEPLRELTFDDTTFRASYTAGLAARHLDALQTLATLYARPDPRSLDAGLRAQLVDLAASPRATNAGPAPAGMAMGNAQQLGNLDLYLADPQIRGLIDRDGGTPPAATSTQAREQVQLLGQARFDQLGRLTRAMDHVRQQYVQAMTQAVNSGQGPGWIEYTRTVTDGGVDEGGRSLIGLPTRTIVERVFDHDTFTAWYIAQPGQSNQAFGSFYGASTTTITRDEGYTNSWDGATHVTQRFAANPGWVIEDGVMRREGLERLNLDDLPRLHDPTKVFYDLEAGWVTPQDNLHQNNGFERFVGIVFVVAASYVSAGTLGPEAAAAMGLTEAGGAAASVGVMGANYGGGLTLAGTMVSAGVVGAVGSIASGIVSGNLTLRGIVQGALAGALSAGLMNGLTAAVEPNAVGTIAARTTIQGGIQVLLGGRFRDGAITGFASGLADLASGAMNQNINEALRAGTMSASDAVAARAFVRMVGSAIRAAANPNDPAYAFATDLLGQLVNQGLENSAGPPPAATAAPAFDPNVSRDDPAAPADAPSAAPPQEAAPDGEGDNSANRVVIIGSRITGLRTDTRYPVPDPPEWARGATYTFDSTGEAFWHLPDGSIRNIPPTYATPTHSELQTNVFWQNFPQAMVNAPVGMAQGMWRLVSGQSSWDEFFTGMYENSPVGVLGAMADDRPDLAANRLAGTAWGLAAGRATEVGIEGLAGLARAERGVGETPVAVSEGEANTTTGARLADDLQAGQAFDPLIGTTPPGARAPISVTAEAFVGDRVLFDTNQTARPMTEAQAQRPTLIADLVEPGNPNGTMGEAHAEISVIQRAYDAGLTEGQSMTIVVRGVEMCDYCARSVDGLIAAADRSGLSTLTVVDTVRQRQYTWNRGNASWTESAIPNR